MLTTWTEKYVLIEVDSEEMEINKKLNKHGVSKSNRYFAVYITQFRVFQKFCSTKRRFTLSKT